MSGQSSLENFGAFPPGFRFQPTDEELMRYLSMKDKGEAMPPNNIISVNLYNYNPGTLAEMYKGLWEREWYVFTPRERKYLNGERPKRSAGNGYWKATGADKPIRRGDECIGLKKALVFYIGKAPGGQKTNWIMHEYRLPKPAAPKSKTEKRKNKDMKLDNWVLCRIYGKDERPSNAGLRRTGSNQDSGHNHDQQNDSDKSSNGSAMSTEDQPNPSTLNHDEDHHGDHNQHYEAESLVQGMQPLPENEQDGLLQQDHSLVTNALDNFENYDQSQAPLYNDPPVYQQQQEILAYNQINMDNFQQQQEILAYNQINMDNFQQQQEILAYNQINMDNFQQQQQQLLVQGMAQQQEIGYNYCVNMDNFMAAQQQVQDPYNYINAGNMQQPLLSSNYNDNYIHEEPYGQQYCYHQNYGYHQNYSLPPSYSSTTVPVPCQDQFSLLPPADLPYNYQQYSVVDNVQQNGVFTYNHDGEGTAFYP